MSTPNFCYENILVAVEDEEGDLNGYLAELNIESLQGELQAKFKNGYIPGDREKWDNYNRSYPGRVIFRIPFYTLNGLNQYKNLDVIVRSGYFSGYNYDWSLSDIDWCYVTKESKTIEAKIESAIKKIEKIIRSAGTELNCDGIFSNGEAIYSIKK